jgi:hypothetical protein
MGKCGITGTLRDGRGGAKIHFGTVIFAIDGNPRLGIATSPLFHSNTFHKLPYAFSHILEDTPIPPPPLYFGIPPKTKIGAAIFSQ